MADVSVTGPSADTNLFLQKMRSFVDRYHRLVPHPESPAVQEHLFSFIDGIADIHDFLSDHLDTMYFPESVMPAMVDHIMPALLELFKIRAAYWAYVQKLIEDPREPNRFDCYFLPAHVKIIERFLRSYDDCVA